MFGWFAVLLGFACVSYLVDGLCLLCLCGMLSFEGWFLCFGFALWCGGLCCFCCWLGSLVFALMMVGVGVFGYVGVCCGVAS